jgi:hypothetical protein
MSVYRGLRVSRRRVVLLRPDGTYCVQRVSEPSVIPPEADAAHMAVARAALRELRERRLRDGVARRLLREAGVIGD